MIPEQQILAMRLCAYRSMRVGDEYQATIPPTRSLSPYTERSTLVNIVTSSNQGPGMIINIQPVQTSDQPTVQFEPGPFFETLEVFSDTRNPNDDGLTDGYAYVAHWTRIRISPSDIDMDVDRETLERFNFMVVEVDGFDRFIHVSYFVDQTLYKKIQRKRDAVASMFNVFIHRRSTIYIWQDAHTFRVYHNGRADAVRLHPIFNAPFRELGIDVSLPLAGTERFDPIQLDDEP